MSSSGNHNNAFGRDEMNALLGGATEEMAAFSSRPSATTMPGGGGTMKKKSTKGSSEPDISTMTASETAAMLLDKNNHKRQHDRSQRTYRTNRKLAHHELAEELASKQNILASCCLIHFLPRWYIVIGRV